MTMPAESHNRSPLIDETLRDAREKFAASHPKAAVAFQRACAVMPGGNTRTVLFHGPFPIRVVRGEGAYLFDADDNRYLDLLGEYTAGIFGHSNPVIRSAIDKALDEGWNFGAHNAYEIELAELVCARFPSIDRVRFTNSGTEANLMALGAARCFTGRDKVMVFNGGYHGGVLYFGHGGSPVNAPYPTVLAPYNDVDGITSLFEKHGRELACVLVEPMMGSGGCIVGSDEFLQTLRELCSDAGTVLIFDEVMTSRSAGGGYQSACGILPDMTTLGKYIGGGMSFGAFGGREDIMAQFDPASPDALPHAGTFNNNVVTMAAGIAAMRDIYTPERADALFALGESLRNRLNDVFRAQDAQFQATGLGSIIGLHPTRVVKGSPDHDEGDDRLMELLFLNLLERGFYIARRGFIALNLEITEVELDGFVTTVEEILKAYPVEFAAQ